MITSRLNCGEILIALQLLAIPCLSGCEQGGELVPLSAQASAAFAACPNAEPSGHAGGTDHGATHVGLQLNEGAHTSGSAAGADIVTYFGVIEPLLRASCTSCHFPGTNEGMDLSSFEKAKQYFESILVSIQKKPSETGFMPVGANALAADKISLFQKWKADGFQMGVDPCL